MSEFTEGSQHEPLLNEEKQKTRQVLTAVTFAAINFDQRELFIDLQVYPPKIAIVNIAFDRLESSPRAATLSTEQYLAQAISMNGGE